MGRAEGLGNLWGLIGEGELGEIGGLQDCGLGCWDIGVYRRMRGCMFIYCCCYRALCIVHCGGIKIRYLDAVATWMDT